MTRYRFKHFLRERDQYSIRGEENLLSVSEYYGVKPRSEAFEGDAGEGRAATLEGYRIVKTGDFVMNYMLAWKGAYGLSDYDGITSPAYAVFDVDTSKVDRRFLHHRTRSKDMQVEFRSQSKGIIESRLRLYPDALLAMQVELPDLPTQKRIADFLDRETARIDALIEKKERLIAALADKLRVAITKAVTQGFNAGADTKESGIDWIGRIPAHWRVMKLGYLGRCANGINIGGEAFGSGHPFISYGDVYKNRVLPLTISGLVQSTASDRSTYSVKAGDVLFTRTSETIEEVGFSSVCMETVENAVFAGFLIRFRPSRGKLHPLFSKFAFQHSGLRHYFAKEMNLITRASLSQDLLRNLPVALPPLEEQAEIGRELEKLEASISTITNKTKITVAMLKERRAALITAAVTGQIDVSEHRMSTRAAETAERFVKEVTK